MKREEPVTGVPRPKVALTGSCACVHLACEHPQGKCPVLPVVVEKQLGMPAKLCEKCAARWGFTLDGRDPK
jgi:hypothetical protein